MQAGAPMAPRLIIALAAACMALMAALVGQFGRHEAWQRRELCRALVHDRGPGLCLCVCTCVLRVYARARPGNAPGEACVV